MKAILTLFKAGYLQPIVIQEPQPEWFLAETEPGLVSLQPKWLWIYGKAAGISGLIKSWPIGAMHWLATVMPW